MSRKNSFKFYTPINIKKGQDEKGNEVMRIGGIASTADRDSEGEYLDPSGFILNDFLTTGFVNWHHQAKDKPKAIVGEPTLAEIRPDGLYVECELYPSSTIAREIYETATTLQKDSKTRRLGFSIEGEVLERESEDKTDPGYFKIKKANITGLAITHMPINGKTFAEIIKGNIGDNETIEDEDGEDSSGLTTKNSKAILKESLDKDLKILEPKIIKSKFELVNFSEERMYDTIFDTFPDISIEKAEQVFILLTKINDAMSKKNLQITDNDIKKAFNALNLKMDDSNPFIQKAEEDDDDDDDISEEEQAILNKVESAYKNKNQKLSDYEKEEGIEDKDDEEEIEKGKKESGINTNRGVLLAMNKIIQKAQTQSTEENRALGVLLKSVIDDNEILKGNIQDALEVISEQKEIIKGFNHKLTLFGDSPKERKSITKARALERFNNNPYSGVTQISKSRQRSTVLEILDKKTFEKGFNEYYSGVTTTFESSGMIPSAVIEELRRDNIEIVE